MKKIKYLIIGIIIVIIIIAVIILAINLHDRNVNPEAYHQYNDTSANTDEINQIIDYKRNLNEVNNSDEFFTVTNCVSEYITSVNNINLTNLNENSTAEAKKGLSKKVYDLLSEEYISKYNISENNVSNFIENETNLAYFIPLKMNSITSNDIVTAEVGSSIRYAVYGILEDINYNYIRDLYIIVNIDNVNNTFSVEPILNDEYTDINEIELSNELMEISENDNNQVTTVVAGYEYVSQKYLDYYKKLALGRPDIAYELLDEEYREKRFGNYDAYKQYIEENKEDIKVIQLSQYMVNRDNNVEQYVCKDTYGKIYMFEEENPMELSIQLDTYTIETDAFKEQYESGNEQVKAQMNIYKFILMINNQDYQKAYDLLDENFKNNYFKTVDDFKRYMSIKAYKYNSLEFTSFNVTGNIYSCGASVSDLTGGLREDSTKGDGGSGYIYEWTFYIQLEGDRDFVISFDVDTDIMNN